MDFHIEAQPVDAAIAAFALATNVAALVDVQTGHSQMANAVNGFLTVDEAARIMLAGTGLKIRFVGSGSFVVENAPGIPPMSGLRPEYETAFFAQLQKSVMDAVCRDATSSVGAFDATVQVWIAADGHIRAVHVAGMNGDVLQTASLRRSLLVASVSPPPPGLSQPVTVAFERINSNDNRPCGEP